MDFPPKDDIVISIVGSQFLYKGQWLEHALFLEALRPLFSNYNSESYKSHLKIIALGGESASNYSVAIEVWQKVCFVAFEDTDYKITNLVLFEFVRQFPRTWHIQKMLWSM